jgi:oligopeptide transport system substrate-binding protein
VSVYRPPIVFVLLLLLAPACFQQEQVAMKPAPPEATPGGRLSVAITPPASIDPGNAFEPMGSMVVRALCDPLIDFDPETGELKPAIAESWQVSDGGTQITLKLREGVRFHNGDEVTADDVVFALSRVADAEYASALAPLLEPVAGYEFIHGDAETDNEDLLRRIAGVMATESYGVQISLNDNRADFLRVLAHPLASPIPAEAVEADAQGFEQRPVCTGPYRMAEAWDPSTPLIRLERFDDYHGQNLAYTNGGGGYFHQIDFHIHRDARTAYESYLSGNADVVEVPPPRIAEASGARGFLQVPSGSLEYIGLPTTVEPFDDPQVRLAFSQAADRSALVESVFDGGRLPATGFLPPSVGGVYQENACGEGAPATADLAAASELIASAGAELDGTRMPFYFNDDFQNRSIVQNVADQWNAAFGVEFDLTPMPWNDFLPRASSQQGFDGPFRMSWEGPYPGPDAYLYPLFHSDNIGSDNFTRFSEPPLDRLLERSARRTETEDDLTIEYRRLEGLICEEMPAVPLTFGSREFLVRAARFDSAIEGFGEAAWGQPALRELFVRAS